MNFLISLKGMRLIQDVRKLIVQMISTMTTVLMYSDEPVGGGESSGE